MITRLLSLFSVGLLTGCPVALIAFGTVEARAAGEANFGVQLVWGSNGEKPKQPLKPVDAKLQEKFKKVFKWKEYYEVNRQSLAVPKGTSQKLKLSDKCEIEVQDLGDNKFEIRLVGEGTLILKQVQKVSAGGDPVVLAGHSENETAWLVVLTRPK